MRNTHQEIIKQMEKLAPLHFAYDWDNVGLQIGNQTDETQSILTTLDVTEAVVDEAIAVGANLIIAHHPLLFQSLKKVDTSSVKGRIIAKLIKYDITVYAAHTNLDIAVGGVNDMLAEELEVMDTKPLIPTQYEKLYKVIVFIPSQYAKKMLDALGAAGAGQIGDYSHCGYMSEGIGTFRPNENANPFVGDIGKQHEEDEVRLEMIVPEDKLTAVQEALMLTHPYEEPAYDILLLNNKGVVNGLGRIGSLDESMTVEELSDRIKRQLDVSHVRITGNSEKLVQKIAILGGSGEKFVQAAIKANADVYITGDMTFHAAQDAEADGMTVIDAGHIIEKVMIRYMATYLQKHFPNYTIKQSNINTDPFRYY